MFSASVFTDYKHNVAGVKTLSLPLEIILKYTLPILLECAQIVHLNTEFKPSETFKDNHLFHTFIISVRQQLIMHLSNPCK